MKPELRKDPRQRCATCGQPVDIFFSGPDSGVFMACGCGPRPVSMMAPLSMGFGITITIGIASAAGLLLLLG